MYWYWLIFGKQIFKKLNFRWILRGKGCMYQKSFNLKAKFSETLQKCLCDEAFLIQNTKENIRPLGLIGPY